MNNEFLLNIKIKVFVIILLDIEQSFRAFYSRIILYHVETKQCRQVIY